LLARRPREPWREGRLRDAPSPADRDLRGKGESGGVARAFACSRSEADNDGVAFLVDRPAALVVAALVAGAAACGGGSPTAAGGGAGGAAAGGTTGMAGRP